MAVTKFYHYNLWVENEDGNRIRPQKVIKKVDLYPDEHDTKTCQVKEQV